MKNKILLGSVVTLLLFQSPIFAKFSEKEEERKASFELDEVKKNIKKSYRQATLKAEDELADLKRKERSELLNDYQDEYKNVRINNVKSYKEVKETEVAKDYKDGRYADLYKLPAWPFQAKFAEHKDLFEVDAKFVYANRSLDSDGTEQNLSDLVFGQRTIRLKDILLASKLISKGQAVNSDEHQYLNYLKNSVIDFNCSSKEWGFSLDFMRYLKGHDVSVGFQVPFGYKKNKIRATLKDEVYDNIWLDEYERLASSEELIPAIYYQTPGYYAQTYGSEFNNMLNDLLNAKGIKDATDRSVTGIGDISMFANFAINSKYFEKLAVGLQVTLPTAKQANASKLFAPELGNGGFTQFSLFGSALVNRQSKYINPHGFMQFDYTMQGHVDKRVPKLFDSSVDSQWDMTWGNRISYVQVDDKNPVFKEYDTNLPAFADNVKSVKIRPGLQFDVRLGNMIEKFILRRGFLDIFYDFTAKLKDRIGGGLDRSVWNVDSLKENTDRISHKIGLDYSYQFDHQARIRAGVNYVFAGINVPQNFEANCSFGIEF